jgi:hypothetical protein
MYERSQLPPQKKKKLIVLLKMEFAKAFDTIEHEAILQIMKFRGFNSMAEMEKFYIINRNFSYSFKWYSGKAVCLQMWCAQK